jgi:hypothetical protein
VVVLLFGGTAWGQLKPAIAYSEDGDVYLVAGSGEILRKVKSPLPIYDFAVSPDAQLIVFNRVGPREHGGPLYLLRIATGETARLTPRTSEVYADPEFSPNGDRIVFAIHAQAGGDLVEAAGPLGTIDIKTRRLSVLAATANVDGHGPCYSNEPHWDPNGRQILFSCEAGVEEVGANGKYLRDLTSMLVGGDWSHALGWIGSRCAVYLAGNNQKEAAHNPIRVLYLDTGKTELAEQLLGLPDDVLKDLVAVSPGLRVRAVGAKLLVEGGPHSWEMPVKDRRKVTVRMLPQSDSARDSARVPEACR